MGSIALTIRNAFSGLNKPTWLLAIMILINRIGFMVLPFLAIYSTEVLQYNIARAGIVLSVYGLGSVCASVAGGWLTDKFGQFHMQFISQVAGGVLYFLVLQLQQFEFVVAGVFVLSLVNDLIRPANAAAIAQYASPEAITRAYSLNRMAINLGFMVGPALGGILVTLSYDWLFYVNGGTSIIAGIYFFWHFRGIRNAGMPDKPGGLPQNIAPSQSPYWDVTFLLFVLLCSCFATIFFQLFSTLPLYYKQVYQLSEDRIGMLLSFNGLMALLLEMVLIYLLSKYSKRKVWIAVGVLLLGVSFILLNLVQHTIILFVAMLLFSLSEILAMPFMSTLTAERSDARNRGAYMGLFTVSWAAPLIAAPYLGTTIVTNYGFTTLWWATGGLSAVTALGLFWVVQLMEREKKQRQPVLS